MRYFSNPYFMLMVQTMWSRNIMYYEQSLSQILTTSVFSAVFNAFAQIFNLSITDYVGSSDASSICFVDGLNAKQKILSNLIMPFMIIFFILPIHLISRFVCNQSLVLCKKRKINFPKTYISAFLLIIGNVMTVLFQLMNCQKLGTISVHTFFGNEHCYTSTWIVSFLCLMLIIIIFFMIFWRLKKIGIEERNNKDNVLNTFVSKYKPRYFYWEFVIFIRRICVAMFTVSITDDTSRIIFIITIITFTIFQRNCKPFIVHSSNKLEFILLSCLSIVIMSHSLSSVNGTFNNVITSIFIILPILIMIYYIFVFVTNTQTNKWSDGASNIDDDGSDQDKATEMVQDKATKHTVPIDTFFDYRLLEDGNGDSNL
eukprot:76908_1